MKTCPLCGAGYTDEYRYCKLDGAELAVNSVEPVPELLPSSKKKLSRLVLPTVLGGGSLLLLVGWIVLSIRPTPLSTPTPDPLPNSVVSQPVPGRTKEQIRMAEALGALDEIYMTSDRDYGNRNAFSHMAPIAPEWTFVDKDGSVETRAESLHYFEKRFSNTDPERVTNCHMETTVLENPSPRFEGDTLVVRISVSASYTDTRGKKHQISATQEDRWRLIDQMWKCVHSNLLSRKSH